MFFQGKITIFNQNEISNKNVLFEGHGTFPLTFHLLVFYQYVHRQSTRGRKELLKVVNKNEQQDGTLSSHFVP